MRYAIRYTVAKNKGWDEEEDRTMCPLYVCRGVTRRRRRNKRNS